MDYLTSGLKSCAMIAAKVGINVVIPGSVVAFDVGEGIYYFYNGDNASGVVSLISAGYNLVSGGMYGAVKESAKAVGKGAMTKTAKDVVKEATKSYGKKAAEEIAKGGPKNVVVNAAVEASKATRKEVGKFVAKQIGQGVIEQIVDNGAKCVAKNSVTRVVSMATIASGGKNVGQEIAKALCEKSISDMFEASAREVGKNIYTDATEKVVFKMFHEAANYTLKLEFGASVVKGTISWWF